MLLVIFFFGLLGGGECFLIVLVGVVFNLEWFNGFQKESVAIKTKTFFDVQYPKTFFDGALFPLDEGKNFSFLFDLIVLFRFPFKLGLLFLFFFFFFILCIFSLVVLIALHPLTLAFFFPFFSFQKSKETFILGKKRDEFLSHPLFFPLPSP